MEMEHMDKVEKLRQKANVSYEDARNALEQNDWDLLDALIALENAGKIKKEPEDSYSTRKEPEPQKQPEPDLRGSFTRFFSYIAELINKANLISMDVTRSGKTRVSIPLSVLILLLIFMFWWVVPLMVLGLFFGFRYSFRGHKAADSVNRVMDKAAQTAEDFTESIARKNRDGEDRQ